ncbi:helix-turn-helix domain-containing protein [Clostridium neonatale]|uniref:helix-turn-helix domain-containing protein n=1 Tax=Clostridium neonatale TaxID=137838 RepID=UPI00291B5A7F|nr:Helix-turn-helix domain-containing protein [Clostridium neonatale]CAI3701914.1 Helix-turn-helix domain-containing protein [Clostridium neonatale]
MTKDYLKFRNAIKKDENLSLEEAYLLENIFDYYNINCGYAFPSYDVLMEDLKTKRRAKVSKLLKSLVKKGYILIQKSGKKNTYKLLKYLFFHKKVKEKENLEQTTEEESKVIEVTGCTKGQAKKLLELSKNKIEKVIATFEYATANGAKKTYSYVKALLERNIDISSKYKGKTIPFITTCEGRNYSEEWYEDIERKLLGWSD